MVEWNRPLFITDISSPENVSRIHINYCTFDYELAAYFVNKRVRLVGINYMSIERPRTQMKKGKSVHISLLRNDIIIKLL